MDRSLFLDVNQLTRESAWAHGTMRFLAHGAGIAIVALLVVAAFLRARSHWRTANPERFSAIAWIPIGAILSGAVGELIEHLVGRRSPAIAVRGAEILVTVSSHHGSLPSESAVIAAAVAAGLWLAGERLIATLATVMAALLAFDSVYVGAHYPGDVVAGLALGAILSIVGLVVTEPWLDKLFDGASHGPLASVVGGERARPLVTSGPASTPRPLRATGSVRILAAEDRAYGRSGAPDVTGS